MFYLIVFQVRFSNYSVGAKKKKAKMAVLLFFHEMITLGLFGILLIVPENITDGTWIVTESNILIL